MATTKISAEFLEKACGHPKERYAPFSEGDVLERVVLKAAFDLVANKTDWKAPVDAYVEGETCDFSEDVICRAVEFFTATTATVSRGIDCGAVASTYRVRAAGYRAGPAGDH